VAFSAQGEMRKGPGYDEVAVIVAKYLNLTPDKVADIFPSFDPTGALDVADVKEQVAFYQARGMVDKTADVDAMLDLSFLAGKGR
jgi:NitT/TauT family transport system substrate-binding protein